MRRRSSLRPFRTCARLHSAAFSRGGKTAAGGSGGPFSRLKDIKLKHDEQILGAWKQHKKKEKEQVQLHPQALALPPWGAHRHLGSHIRVRKENNKRGNKSQAQRRLRRRCKRGGAPKVDLR